MSRAPTYLAIALIVLALPEIPWIFLSPGAIASGSGYSNEFAEAIWVHNIIDVVGFLGAGALVAFRVRLWPIAALLICSYVTLIATPPFVRLLIRNGALNMLESTWRHAVKSGLPDGFYALWNLFVLPIVPALLIPLVLIVWWQARVSHHAAESNFSSSGRAEARRSTRR